MPSFKTHKHEFPYMMQCKTKSFLFLTNQSRVIKDVDNINQLNCNNNHRIVEDCNTKTLLKIKVENPLGG